MKRYSYKQGLGIVDETGLLIIQMMPVNCSKKFAATAAKLLAEKLNTIERGGGFNKPAKQEVKK